MARRTQRYKALLESGVQPERFAPIQFLEELKRSLEHTRRFTVDMQPRIGDPYVNKVCSTESDIEAWLLKHGFWESEDYDDEVIDLLMAAEDA